MSAKRKKKRKGTLLNKSKLNQQNTEDRLAAPPAQDHNTKSNYKYEQDKHYHKSKGIETNSSKKTKDEKATRRKWFIAAISAVIGIFVGALNNIPADIKSVSGMLLIPAIVMFISSQNSKFSIFYSAIDNNAIRHQIDSENARYSKLTRNSKLAYNLVFALGLMMLPISFAMFLNQTQGFEVVITGFVIFLPTAIAKYFSDNLFKAKVDELNYIKGTSTSREIAVYWAALIVFAIYTVIAPGALLSVETTKVVTQALGFVALARILSSGYKEYKEALSDFSSDSRTTNSQTEDAIPFRADKPTSKNVSLKFDATNILFNTPNLRVNTDSKITAKYLQIVQLISAPHMTIGKQSNRFPINKEPYGRARIPTAEGVIVVDGKVLRTEDGPLVEFWRSLPYGRQLKVYLPASWVERINRDESEWTHPYDIPTK